MKPAVLIFVFVAISAMATAQTKEERKYNERAQEVEEEVMGAADPLFASNTVPDAFAKSSAVILARKIDIYADRTNKVKRSLFYRSVQNTVRYMMTFREKIKIIDKNALAEYTELSFSKIRRQSNFFKSRTFSFVGIRLLKPDGTVKKINVDEEAVNEASEEEKEKYKLAIPGLEVGDIIDIYTRVETEISNDKALDPLDIMLAGEYPVVKFSFNTKVANDFAVLYRSDNGAPSLDKDKDNEFLYLKMEAENLKGTADHPWVYERREQPVFKIRIVPPFEQTTNPKAGIMKGQMMWEFPKKWIDNFYVSVLSNLVSNWPEKPSPNVKLLKDHIKKISNGDESKLSTDSIIHIIYYFGRYLFLYNDISEEKVEVGIDRNFAGTTFRFYQYLLEAFHEYSIEFDYLYTVPRGTGTINSVLWYDELVPIIRAFAQRRQYYLVPPDMFTIANSFPAAYEGQQAYAFLHGDVIGQGDESVIQKVPLTKASFNYMAEDLEVSINPGKPQQLDIRRIRTQRGNSAYDDQVRLLLFEEYVDEESARFGGKPFAQELVDRFGKKKGTQLLEEYTKAFAEARKQRFEYAKKELMGTFETKDIVLDSFRVVKTGSRHDQTDFVFEEKFSMDGMLKKAGNNYILDISSLLTDQVQIKSEQRQREYNIYMPYARTYDYKISLTIPAGYTVQGLENLQKNISNETGSFISSAVVENGKLVIKASKVYNRNYEPASEWGKMLEFVDAAYNFTQEKILLKKI